MTKPFTRAIAEFGAAFGAQIFRPTETAPTVTDEFRETIVVQEAVTRDSVMWRLPFDTLRVYEDEIPEIRRDIAGGRLMLAKDEHNIFVRPNTRLSNPGKSR